MFVVEPVEDRDELRGEVVAERDERFVVLVVGYAAAVVLVEAVEQGAPRGEEAPEAATVWVSRGNFGVACRWKDVIVPADLPKLLEADGATPVGIEHADHHPHGM